MRKAYSSVIWHDPVTIVARAELYDRRSYVRVLADVDAQYPPATTPSVAVVPAEHD